MTDEEISEEVRRIMFGTLVTLWCDGVAVGQQRVMPGDKIAFTVPCGGEYKVSIDNKPVTTEPVYMAATDELTVTVKP